MPLKVAGAAGEATLQEGIYRPLIATLADKHHAPKSLRELTARLPDQAYPQLLQAVVVLIGMGVAAPCQPDAAAKQVHRRCVAINNHLCERAQFGNEIETLASPVLGGGVSVGRFPQLFLLARAQGKKTPQEWAQHVWQILVAQGQKLVKEGKVIDTAEENLAELNRQATEFAEQRLPILKTLGVA